MGAVFPWAWPLPAPTSPDFKLMRPTLRSMPVARPPQCTRHRPGGMCLDKGFDYDEVRARPSSTASPCTCLLAAQPLAARAARRHGAGWWSVPTGGFNKFRRLLVRWEKREDTYLAMLHLALGIITWFHNLFPS